MEKPENNSTITHNKWNFDFNKPKSIYELNDKQSEKKYFFKNYENEIKPSIHNINELCIDSYRKAGVIHKLARSELRSEIKSGVAFIKLIEKLDFIIQKFKKNEENIGLAFPLGISVNEIGAHDSAMINDNRVFKKNDIVKIDLGIHVNGCIVDSAFTIIVDGDDDFNYTYKPLLDATIDATYSGIKMSGPDAILKEISQEIKEVIESYELNDDKSTPINPIWGLGGHNILPYKVHGGKLILCVPHESQNGQRMMVDEIYAIETFASTGKGKVIQKDPCYCNHFMLNDNKKFESKLSNSKNSVVNWVKTKNNNLPFTQLWCTEIKSSKELLTQGIRENMIVQYPPLSDVIGTYTSQLEHTIHIKESSLEILTLGRDY